MHSGEMIRGYFQTHTGEWPALPSVPSGHPLWAAFVEFVADEASGVRKDLTVPIVFVSHGDLLWKAFVAGASSLN